ncbi:unnamed protein product [Lymnaea stagnalis]|uniref:Voltage-gated hydrogen channel 1 n=1 Tax=Lymnaea stagnalis TaxID=6523 RepID=A0AAV2HJX3_LYMST
MNIFESDCVSIVEADPENRKPCKERLLHFLESQKFQIFIIVLVCVDCLIVLIELLLGLETFKLDIDKTLQHKIFSGLSLTILSIFIVEVILRIYVMRLGFFRSKMEIFDGLVVIVSFILDIVFFDHGDVSKGTGLLILLRLWRVARVVNGVILSVNRQASHKIKKEQNLRLAKENELKELKLKLAELEAQVDNHRELLRTHNIYPDGGTTVLTLNAGV